MTVGYSPSSASSGVLSVSNGAQSANIALLGNYLASSFTLGSDGHGGTAIADAQQLRNAADLGGQTCLRWRSVLQERWTAPLLRVLEALIVRGRESFSE